MEKEELKLNARKSYINDKKSLQTSGYNHTEVGLNDYRIKVLTENQILNSGPGICFDLFQGSDQDLRNVIYFYVYSVY